MTSRPPADSGRRTDNPDPVDPFTDPTIAPMQDERQRVLRQVFGDQQGASPAGAFSIALDVEEAKPRRIQINTN